MRVRRFEWEGAKPTAKAARDWAFESQGNDAIADVVRDIGAKVFYEGDDALLELTERHDGERLAPEQIRVDPAIADAALRALDPALREALEVAAANIRTVAEAQAPMPKSAVELPQGQTVTIRESPVAAAGVYAPGGRATYPSSVLMCAIPARVAGVERIALVSPPGESGRPSDLILAAAAFCGIDEIYAVGGAQAIFALAFGTATIPAVDVDRRSGQSLGPRG